VKTEPVYNNDNQHIFFLDEADGSNQNIFKQNYLLKQQQ
jgi:hypothetical protein